MEYLFPFVCYLVCKKNPIICLGANMPPSTATLSFPQQLPPLSLLSHPLTPLLSSPLFSPHTWSIRSIIQLADLSCPFGLVNLYMKHILWKRVVTDQVYLKYLYCLFLCSVWNRHQNWRWWNRCWHCSKNLRWSRLHQMQISLEIRNWVGMCCKTETLGNPYHDDLERWQTDTFSSSDILGSCVKVIMKKILYY